MTKDDSDADEMHPQETRQGTETAADPQVDWTEVPANPDPESLGYECDEWERIPVADSKEQVIFLPGNEDDLADDAFVVLDDSDLCDLVTRR